MRQHGGGVPGRHREVRGSQPHRPGCGSLCAPGQAPAFDAQLLGGPASGGGLRRSPLRLAQLDDRLYERGELRDQYRLGGAQVIAADCGARQQPGGLAQAFPAGVGRGIRA